MAARVALVTGSTSGVELGIARTLAKKYDVIMTGVADNKTKHTNSILTDVKRNRLSEGASHFLDSDLSKADGVASLCNDVMKLYPKGVDILVNNAGNQHVALVEDFPISRWDEIIHHHLTVPFLLTRHFMPYMKERGWGRIINMSSINGIVGSPGKVPCCTAKWGMIGMIKAAALECAEYGVTCNAVCPAYTKEVIDERIQGIAESMGIPYDVAEEEYFKHAQPTKQPIKIEHIAGLVAFLCSDEAGSITGSSYMIDGGYTAR